MGGCSSSWESPAWARRASRRKSPSAPERSFRIITGRCYEPQQSVAYYPFLEALTTVAQESPAKSPQSCLCAGLRWRACSPITRQNCPSPTQINDRAAQQRLFWQVTGSPARVGQIGATRPADWTICIGQIAPVSTCCNIWRATPATDASSRGNLPRCRGHPPARRALHDLSRDELVERIAGAATGSSEETTTLIGATLKASEGAEASTASVSPHLAQLIQQRSEGNAFFTRQLTRALQEQGMLRFEDGQWRLSVRARRFPLPESIRAVIGQRLARLTPLTQDVLREASVLGQVLCLRRSTENERSQRAGGRRRARRGGEERASCARESLTTITSIMPSPSTRSTPTCPPGASGDCIARRPTPSSGCRTTSGGRLSWPITSSLLMRAHAHCPTPCWRVIRRRRSTPMSRPRTTTAPQLRWRVIW